MVAIVPIDLTSQSSGITTTSVCLYPACKLLIFHLTQTQLHLMSQLFAVGQIKLIFLHKKLAVHLIGCIFHQQFILVFGENNADGWIVAFDVFLVGKVAHIHIHLADVVVLYLINLEVYQHEAAQNAVIKNQINFVVGVVDRYTILAANKGEALAQFQQKLLQVIAQHRFKVGFRNFVRFGNFQKLKHIRLAQQVSRLFDNLPLSSELLDTGLVFACKQGAKKAR